MPNMKEPPHKNSRHQKLDEHHVCPKELQILQRHCTTFGRKEVLVSGICVPFVLIESMAIDFQVFLAMGV